ncbi:hypothetical protein CP97_10755 [Aurantiacibacter atlanticus]|uniref:Uncharacterized protein n=1 Tax=Aurantiacibacter atlanticus TaxID=1648404 RepID=A0A0H4VYZ7_9SPHN|nr:MAPEG family protein [Aurantiacibacter atlanticus]AKQ42403.1 hypothetical protein CP97_10755 [Aurantiacibacter atlanticus]MDF1834476.1 MAPEG family protein [Alteraurantiacibacter sp. bin_em_oilr2.035]
MILPATTLLAIGAALLTIWHIVRIGQVRMSEKVLHGSGSSELLARRMRGQLNFVESTPFVIALAALIELAERGGVWLLVIAALFLAGRVVHGIGMDHDYPHKGRQLGTIVTALTLLVLAVAMSLIAFSII